MKRYTLLFFCFLLAATMSHAQDAQKDTTFNNGSGITSIQTDRNTIENLRILGMVWGFLKYYHPAVASGNYNWDYELFRVLPKILHAKDANARDNILVQWIKGLGDVQESDGGYGGGDIKMKPDLGWLTSSAISGDLSNLLVKIEKAKRSHTNYYVSLAPGVGNPVFNNEARYDNMRFPDVGFRLLALYRYWNIIQYFAPYKYLIGEDWKRVLPEFIPKFIQDTNATTYTLTALQLIAKVHDTHANIWRNNQVLANYFGNRYALPMMTFIGDTAVVKGFFEPATGEKSGLQRGDIITKIDGKDIADIIKDNLKITPASNYPTQLRDLAFGLLRTNDSVINISYVHDRRSIETTLKTYPMNSNVINEMYAKAYNKPDTCFKMITPDIGYLYLGSVKSSYLPDIFRQLKNKRGLIIDLRCYPSDFVVFTLGQYLMPHKEEFVRFSIGSITDPGLFHLTNPISVGRKNPDYYKGKIVILVNNMTLSQAEYTAMAMRVAPNAVVVGSTTAGADGNVSPFYLPGGIFTMISGIGVYYPNGEETQRKGIIPDVKIEPTVAGIKVGKDEVLNGAIDLIKKG